MPDRLILHIDMNSFYAQVELLTRPELKDKAVAVGGDEKLRHGVVLAKNEAARTFGVRTGESLFEARQKCPSLIILPPHHDLYHEISQQARSMYLEHTELVESFGLDECWVDLTSRLADDSAAAWERSALNEAGKMRAEIRQRLGLTVSIGVSWNKAFAKLGSDYRKPDAVTVIGRSNFKEIVWPLPAGRLLYVGPVSEKKLADVGILTIGQLAEAKPAFLVSILGKSGRDLSRMARGEDTSPVLPAEKQRPLQSVGASQTLAADVSDYASALKPLGELAKEVSTRLREKGLRGQTVHIWIRSSRFRDKTRQRQVSSPLSGEEEIFREAARLLAENEGFSEPVRALGITVSNLLRQGDAWQPSLFDWIETSGGDRNQAAKTRPMPQKLENPKLQEAMRRLREKYGADSIRYGDELGEELGNGQEDS